MILKALIHHPCPYPLYPHPCLQPPRSGKGDERNKKQHKTFRQCVQTPSEIVHHYKSILKTLPKAKTMTRDFQKHVIDRNTVVSTSAI
ncbi:hypothetical protein AOLI_G00138140 [Acnodon oligacanthus]